MAEHQYIHTAPTPSTPTAKSMFLDRLAAFGEADAVVFDGRTHSYGSLTQAVDDWKEFLDRHGVTSGEVVALEGGYTPESCAALLALIDKDAIIVPLSTVPEDKRSEYLDVAQVESIIGIGNDRSTRRFRRTGRESHHDLYVRLREVARPGLVLFSSGTTGRSKASLLDFEKILERYGEPRKPRRILAFLSLDHIGGINTLLHTLSQGGTVITVPDRTPEAVFSAVAEYQVQVLPTTPTFLNMALISGALDRHETKSLETVTYGTEPMPLQVLRRLSSKLPGTRLKQTYGLSELGILPTQSKSDDALWLRLGGAGFDHKIIDDVLWIRSDMAMLGYLNATATFDDEGYFNTQDVVRVSGDYIQILGRCSEIINVGGEKVYPNEVESVLSQADNVAEVTVSGQPNPVTGMVVKAVVRLIHDEDEQAVNRRLRSFCRERLESFKVPAVVEVSSAAQHSERFKKIRSTT
jgi:acyl-CoA synthetase (AMP-forming)/AMP-acid ligase II